jgi:hypothetical protein
VWSSLATDRRLLPTTREDVTHTIYIEDQGGHIYEIGCRNTRAEADETAAVHNRDPIRGGQYFVMSADAPPSRGQDADDEAARTRGSRGQHAR